jgi:hypothetical protein
MLRDFTPVPGEVHSCLFWRRWFSGGGTRPSDLPYALVANLACVVYHALILRREGVVFKLFPSPHDDCHVVHKVDYDGKFLSQAFAEGFACNSGHALRSSLLPHRFNGRFELIELAYGSFELVHLFLLLKSLRVSWCGKCHSDQGVNQPHGLAKFTHVSPCAVLLE